MAKSMLDYTNLIKTKFDRKPTILTGTLSAGSTSLTFTNAAITATAKVDIYTDVYGVSPTAVDDSTVGTLILTFDEQESALSVKVVLRED